MIFFCSVSLTLNLFTIFGKKATKFANDSLCLKLLSFYRLTIDFSQKGDLGLGFDVLHYSPLPWVKDKSIKVVGIDMGSEGKREGLRVENKVGG